MWLTLALFFSLSMFQEILTIILYYPFSDLHISLICWIDWVDWFQTLPLWSQSYRTTQTLPTLSWVGTIVTDQLMRCAVMYSIYIRLCLQGLNLFRIWLILLTYVACACIHALCHNIVQACPGTVYLPCIKMKRTPPLLLFFKAWLMRV